MKKLLILFLLMSATAAAQTTIQPGVSQNSFTAATLATSTGTAYAVPQARGVIITWQLSYAAAPTSITVLLEGSLDNSSWFTLDTSTNVLGEIRYLGPTSPKFIRARISAVNAGAGSALTVVINLLTFNNSVSSGGTLIGRILNIDGTAALPSYSFSSDSNTGMYSSAADTIGWSTNGVNRLTLGASATFSGAVTATSFQAGAGSFFQWASGTTIRSTADGRIQFENNGATIGSHFKFDALPTAGTCGTAPAITAGSTAFSGSINVGTVTPASCIVVFGGTAFPSAPFCTANVVTSTAGTARAIGVLSTTTQVTFTPATAFVDSSVVAWHCISAK